MYETIQSYKIPVFTVCSGFTHKGMPNLPFTYCRTFLSRKAEAQGQQFGENPDEPTTTARWSPGWGKTSSKTRGCRQSLVGQIKGPPASAEGQVGSGHARGRSSVAGTGQQARLGSGWEGVGTAEQIWEQSWRLPLHHWSDGAEPKMCSWNNWTKSIKSAIHASSSSFLPTGNLSKLFLVLCTCFHNCDSEVVKLFLLSTLALPSSKWPSRQAFGKCFEWLLKTLSITSLLHSRASIIMGDEEEFEIMYFWPIAQVQIVKYRNF